MSTYRDNDARLVSAIQFAEGCVNFGKKCEFTTDELRRAFSEVFGTSTVSPILVSPADIQDTLTDWQIFYKEVFDLDVDFSELQVPAHQADLDRVIAVAQGLTINQVFGTCARNFLAWRYTENLDKAVTRNDRISETSYAIRIRDRVEADEELKDRSANWLKEQDIAGMTLLERLLYELKYWKETGKHLDIHNITLCAGSRDSGGDVPYVYWYGGKLYVYWCNPDYADSYLRGRVAVS